MALSIQDPVSVGKVRKIFNFYAAFRRIASDCTTVTLITHNPNQNLDDSLNHQIRTKIPLLRKKFQRPLDYEKFFLPATEETILGKLYNYRSKIVHEGKETIGNENKILRSLESVTDFLRETTSLLILLALHEPELITDLKKC